MTVGQVRMNCLHCGGRIVFSRKADGTEHVHLECGKENGCPILADLRRRHGLIEMHLPEAGNA